MPNPSTMALEDEVACSLRFITKDSGRREEFTTGARRDVQDNKPRYDLIPVSALRRLAELYRRGGEKYGFGNWTKGISFSRIMSSVLRHIYQIMEGDTSEDHKAAVAWGVFTLMAYEQMIADGRLPKELDDLKGKGGILDA